MIRLEKLTRGALIILLFSAPVFLSQAEPGSLARTNASLVPPLADSPLKQLEPGIFEIGSVRFDKNKKNISFPISVNMSEGVVEYLLVSTTGKLHESLLRTDAEPYHIHLAFLFLSTNSTPTNLVNSTNISGTKIGLTVRWKEGAKEIPAEDFIFNAQTKKTMSRGEWLYTGSRLINGTFLAQRDGSIISIIADTDALINSPRPGRENDEIWQANSTNVPPVNTTGQITIQLEK